MSNSSLTNKRVQLLNEQFLNLCKNLSQFIELEIKKYISENLAQISKEFKNLNFNWNNDIKTFIGLYKQKISEEEKIKDVFKDCIFLGYIKKLENYLIAVINYIEENKKKKKILEENSRINEEKINALSDLKDMLNDFFDKKSENNSNKNKNNKKNKDILKDRNFLNIMNKIQLCDSLQKINSDNNNKKNNVNSLNAYNNSNDKLIKNLDCNLSNFILERNNINEEKKNNNNIIENNDKKKCDQKEENKNEKFINKKLSPSILSKINNQDDKSEEFLKNKSDNGLNINNNRNNSTSLNSKKDEIFNDEEMEQLFEIFEIIN